MAKSRALAGIAGEVTERMREKSERPLRPSECHKYLKKELAREFRTMVQGFLEQAKSGSCAHMRFAAELLEPEQADGREGRSAVKLLKELNRME